jgi:methionyl-tRNA formyltransferase
MTPQLDAGPVLVQRATPIDPTETAAELEPRLAALGAEAVQEALAMLSAGKPSAGIVQDQSLASKAPRLKKTDGLVDWHRPAAAIFNQFRALQPWPKIYSFWHPPDGPGDDPPLRLVLDSIAVRPAMGSAQPGVVVSTAPELIVACGDGWIAIERLQAAGKRSMPAVEFLRGHAIRPGDKFAGDDSGII